MSLHMMVQRNVRRAIGTRFFPRIGTKMRGTYIETGIVSKAAAAAYKLVL
jgi:hypothetical protein